MNNPENSEMNVEQKQQINFEHELNGIITNSDGPTDLNVGNENAGDNGAIKKETVTCLQDFDEALDHICKQNKPIGINTQCGIAIEGASFNDLNTSGEINTSTEDNLKNWQTIYEDFIKGTEFKAVEHNNNCEDRNIKKSEAHIQHDSAIFNFIENNKKESSLRKNTNFNKKNASMPNLIKKIPNTIINKDDSITSSVEEDAIENVERNIPFNRQPTETNTFVLKECFDIHKNPTHTNDFEKMEVNTDCDGYNSSDFEFIDEDDALNAPNFTWLSDEPNYGEATTKKKFNFEGDTAKPTTNDRPNFEGRINENGELSLDKVKSVLGIHDHQSIVNPESDEEDKLIYDYFKSLESQSKTKYEFDTSYVDNHRILNNEEYFDLFGGNYTPAMNSFENKATRFGTSMTVHFDEADSAMRASMMCESTPEQIAEAKETTKKILSMYSRENGRINTRQRR